MATTGRRNARADGPAWLFAYGTLGPGGPAGGDPARWCPDAVRGRLYDLGAYPALVDLNDPSSGWVEGHVRPVSVTELTVSLDPYEGVDEGLYRRILTRSQAGRPVWVYVYARRLPRTARGPLARWEGPGRP